MIDNEFLRSLSAKAATILPAAGAAREKAEQELFSLLKSALAPLNLVSREEFLAQLEVLKQAQQKIAELEQRLEGLEAGQPVQQDKQTDGTD